MKKPKRRNPYARVIRKLGHKIKPSAKIYKRSNKRNRQPNSGAEQ